MPPTILAVTGHRPNKLGGYGADAQNKVYKVAYLALKGLEPKKVITGMALGWDTCVALACVRLEIPFVAALPFAGQEKRWTPEQQERYHMLLGKAQEVQVVSEGGFSREAMMVRNRWMIDHCDHVLACYNGDRRSGTGNAIGYAKKLDVPVHNYFERLGIGGVVLLAQ
jgi:uncharacterized phage-like protein YoqJ